MFAHLNDTTKSIVFYGLVIGLSIVVVLAVAPAVPGDGAIIINSLTPLVATALMLFAVTRDGFQRESGLASLRLHRAGLRFWPLALLLPLAVLAISYGLLWASGIAPLSAPPGGEVARLVFRLPIGLAINAVLIQGEEIGFRGYLLPRLLKLGKLRASLVAGAAHAAWHLPLILLTPLYHPEGNRLIVVPLFLLTLTAAGAVYGYLRLASDSLWPPAILHAAFNGFEELLAGFTLAATPLAAEYLGGESGLLSLAATALVAGWLWRRGRRGRLAAEATPVT